MKLIEPKFPLIADSPLMLPAALYAGKVSDKGCRTYIKTRASQGFNCMIWFGMDQKSEDLKKARLNEKYMDGVDRLLDRCGESGMCVVFGIGPRWHDWKTTYSVEKVPTSFCFDLGAAVSYRLRAHGNIAMWMCMSLDDSHANIRQLDLVAAGLRVNSALPIIYHPKAGTIHTADYTAMQSGSHIEKIDPLIKSAPKGKRILAVEYGYEGLDYGHGPLPARLMGQYVAECEGRCDLVSYGCADNFWCANLKTNQKGVGYFLKEATKL